MKAIPPAILICAAAIALPAGPQQQPDPDSPLIRVTVNLVQVDAIVTDKSGKVITDLSPDEFEILQDGKPRKLTRFAFIPIQTGPTPRPPKRADPNAIPIPPTAYKPDQVRRAILLVVDDLALSFESMYYVRDAIKKFTASLQPGDLVAMMRTGSGAGASSFKALGGDTVPADEPDTDSDSDSSEEDLQNRAAGLGTFAAIKWIINGLAPVPGRKSIILLSEGFKLQTRAEGVDTLNGSLTDPLRRLTDQASRAGVVIYSIDPRGLPSLALGAADDAGNPRRAAREQEKRTRDYRQSQEPLLALAADTGGRAFMNSNDVDDSLRRVLDDHASFDLLGYNPEDATFDRKYHKIVVKVKRKGAEVRSRNAL